MAFLYLIGSVAALIFVSLAIAHLRATKQSKAASLYRYSRGVGFLMMAVTMLLMVVGASANSFVVGQVGSWMFWSAAAQMLLAPASITIFKKVSELRNRN
jgi:hypothetical protein